MDRETQEIMTDAEEIRAMTTGKGWELAKSKLDARVLDLQNISNLDISNPETLNTQIAARKMATEMIYEWLKIDVYGAIEARDANITHKEIDKGYVDRI